MPMAERRAHSHLGSRSVSPPHHRLLARDGNFPVSTSPASNSRGSSRVRMLQQYRLCFTGVDNGPSWPDFAHVAGFARPGRRVHWREPAELPRGEFSGPVDTSPTPAICKGLGEA